MATALTTTNGNPLSISNLRNQLSTVTESLHPASGDAIASAILKLHRAGMAYPPGIDAQRAGQIYAFALKAIPLKGLSLAVERYVCGQVEGHNPNFIPTPPAFAAQARKEAAPLYADSARIRETIDAIEAGRPVVDKRTPEEIERVRKLVAGVKAAAEAMRVDEAPGELPERYWRNAENVDPDAEPAERSLEERMSEAMREGGE